MVSFFWSVIFSCDCTLPDELCPANPGECAAAFFCASFTACCLRTSACLARVMAACGLPGATTSNVGFLKSHSLRFSADGAFLPKRQRPVFRSITISGPGFATVGGSCFCVTSTTDRSFCFSLDVVKPLLPYAGGDDDDEATVDERGVVVATELFAIPACFRMHSSLQ